MLILPPGGDYPNPCRLLIWTTTAASASRFLQQMLQIIFAFIPVLRNRPPCLVSCCFIQVLFKFCYLGVVIDYLTGGGSFLQAESSNHVWKIHATIADHQYFSI